MIESSGEPQGPEKDGIHEIQGTENPPTQGSWSCHQGCGSWILPLGVVMRRNGLTAIGFYLELVRFGFLALAVRSSLTFKTLVGDFLS